MSHALGAALLTLCLALAGHTARTAAFDHHQASQRYEDVYYLPPSDWLVLSSAGYQEAFAAGLWLAALVYVGDEFTHRAGAKYLYHYGEAATSLDPNFKRVYQWTASLALYRPQGPTVEDAQRSEDILKQARKRFPDDGEIAWQLGALYAYEFPPLLKDKAEGDRYQATGREMLRIASLLGGGPAWAALNAATGLTKLGKTEQAKRHLMEIYETIDDEQAKEQIEIRLQQLNNEAFVMAMRATVKEFQQQHAADFPYVDDGIYYLLGRRPPSQPVDGVAAYFDPVITRRAGSQPPAD